MFYQGCQLPMLKTVELLNIFLEIMMHFIVGFFDEQPLFLCIDFIFLELLIILIHIC